MIYNIPMNGDSEKTSWLTTDAAWTGQVELFNGSENFAYRSATTSNPSVATPWTMTVDFQQPMPLKSWWWQQYSNGKTPVDTKIYGSSSGAFAGEETLLATFEDVPQGTKTWTLNQHAGRYAYIASGTGAHGVGNFVEILSNTADTLTLAYDWYITPSTDSVYFIADEIWQAKKTFVPACLLKCGGQ